MEDIKIIEAKIAKILRGAAQIGILLVALYITWLIFPKFILPIIGGMAIMTVFYCLAICLAALTNYAYTHINFLKEMSSIGALEILKITVLYVAISSIAVIFSILQ